MFGRFTCKPSCFHQRLGASPKDSQSLDACRTDFHRVMSTGMVYDLATVALWQHNQHFLDRMVFARFTMAYSKTLTSPGPISHDFGLHLCKIQHWGGWHWPSGCLRVRFSYESHYVRLSSAVTLGFRPGAGAVRTLRRRGSVCAWLPNVHRCKLSAKTVGRNHGGYMWILSSFLSPNMWKSK